MRASPSAGRQRRDGRRPSGNNSNATASRPKPGGRPRFCSHAAASPAGSDGRDEEGIVGVLVREIAQPHHYAHEAEDPADRIARDPRHHEGSDGAERERAEHEGQPAESAQPEGVSRRRLAGSQRQQDEGRQRGSDADRPHEQRRPPSAHQSVPRSHSDTWAGWSVSRTTEFSSALSVPRSTWSRSRAENASSVRWASYLRL